MSAPATCPECGGCNLDNQGEDSQGRVTLYCADCDGYFERSGDGLPEDLRGEPDDE